ncbi:MAG: DinB family protein [Bacteroidota bacterium]|nr:DinB family protein [Bacteroidota bacterium]
MENVLSKQFQRQYEMMLGWVDGTVNSLSDEDFKIELSPGKNTGVWILGHIIVSDDDLSTFLGKGELLFPWYVKLFGQGTKVQQVENYPDVATLKKCWKQVSERNKIIYSELTDKELNEPHAMIEDFEKDYFKTKERVIMAWQLHQVYHTGQLAIIESRVGKSKF